MTGVLMVILLTLHIVGICGALALMLIIYWRVIVLLQSFTQYMVWIERKRFLLRLYKDWITARLQAKGLGLVYIDTRV